MVISIRYTSFSCQSYHFVNYSHTSGVPTFLSVRKDVPHPQEAIAFGLSIVNPPPMSDCLKSTTVPSKIAAS